MMMCFPVFIFLVSIGALLCDDENGDRNWDEMMNCAEKRFEECEFEENFPETADELLVFCKKHVARESCILEVDEQCYGFVEDGKKDILNVMETLCDKDNPIFKVISENLQCIEQSTKYEDIHMGFYDMNNTKLSSIKDDANRMFEEDEGAGVCLMIKRWSLSEAVIIGHTCDNLEVKEAVMKLLAIQGDRVKVINGSMTFEYCTPENLEKVTPILERYEAFYLDVVKNYE